MKKSKGVKNKYKIKYIDKNKKTVSIQLNKKNKKHLDGQHNSQLLRI